MLIGGLCVLNAAKFALILQGGLPALDMGSRFQTVFYLYMSFLATVLAPSIVWLVLRRLTDELRAMAARDPLTQLLNRRGLLEGLEAHFRSRTAGPAHLLIADIDHFKHINDTYGHQVGDDVLRQLAQVLQGCTRSTDFVARYGGEEFVVLLPEAHEQAEGQLVAEKIRKAVEDTPFAEVGRVTVSVGHSVSHASDAAGKAVVARADEALYNAKGSGRNRVESIMLTPAQ